MLRRWSTRAFALAHAMIGLLLAGPLAAQAADVPGVRAEYFNWSGSGSPVMPTTTGTVDRLENNISVYYATSAPAGGITPDNYLTRYTGNILIPSTGAYTFQVESDDGVRFYVDCNGDGSFSSSELLIDKWVDQSTATYTASCPGNLTAGQRYNFRFDYYERGGDSTARLSWSGPSPVGSTMTVIGRGNGAQGLYSGVADDTAPTLASTALQCGANTLLYVTFSERMHGSTAQTIANYTLSGGHSVTAATLSGDEQTVALTVSPGISASRTLTVNNVRDLAGNPIVSGSTAAVAYTTSAVSAGLKGVYYNQNSTAGAFFTGSTAQRIDSTVAFDWGSGTPGPSGIQADNFSVRWTGVIQIPTTGNYTFRTRSDDGVRLSINGTQIINNWTGHSATYNSSSAVALAAGSYVPVTLEYYEAGGSAVISLEWQTPGSSSFVTIPASALYYCTSAALGSFSIAPAGTSTSTCSPKDVTITALDNGGNPLTTYTGTMTLTTSNSRGDWSTGSSPTPQGTLNNGTLNDGAGTYAFASGDAGVVKLRLAQSLAQDLTISANDASVIGAATVSSTLSFRDNAFVFAEDASNLVSGSDVAVAGRPHDYTLSLVKKDPSTGSCGVATDFNGTRTLKFWRTDAGTTGNWTAPSIVSPALSIPNAQPAANNLSLAFTSGVASFNLGTTDIGRYAFSVSDSSLSYANTTISGSSNTLTVRPFAIVVQGIKQGSTVNPAGSAAIDSVFAIAGSSFQATVGAYRWTSAMTGNGTDPGNNGSPASGATLANTIAGGLAPSYTGTVTLAPLAASQTPASGVLGTLANGSVSAFSSGSATPTTLQYSEVGSFALATSGVVSSFLGSGLALDALVFNSAGTQSARVGRFIPAGFALSNNAVSYRPSAACASASTFNYMDEPFRLVFTLTAQNALGATTANYIGAFAKLDPTSTSAWQLAGLGGSTLFSATASPARLTLSGASGSWSSGVASGITLTAQATRANPADGPFTTAFGIAPVDSDGVKMLAYDIDVASPTGNDRTQVATVVLRHGRLRLMNAIGAMDRPLTLPLIAQYWNGSAWATNTLDSCTRVPATAVNFGNYRKGITAADTNLGATSTTLSAGQANLVMAAPNGHRGTVDVALSLGSTAADASCLQPWPPGTGDAASAGANLAYLRGGWCGSANDKDPAARASFGLYRGADALIFSRENY